MFIALDIAVLQWGLCHGSCG